MTAAMGLTAMLWAFAGTFVIFVVLKKTMGLRVTPKEEAIGLDITQHNERAYTVIE